MEISTIAGIIIAVIIIIVGFVLVFRKPKEYIPSLESELHINPETNQPVIPRFVRDQLIQAQQIEPEFYPDLNKTNKKQQNTEVAEHTLHTTDTEHLTEDAEKTTTVVEEAVVAEDVQSSDVSTAQASSLEDVETEVDVEKPRVDLGLNTDMQTVEIAAFEEESSILDLHLHEQQVYDEESALSKAQHIIALNVFPNSRKVLSGDKALKIMLRYGLRFGELSCFHRYEKTEEESPLMFSVLRMTDEGPSGFDLETLSAEQVQGLSFFLALPNAHAQKGFDMMVSIAGLIARDIDGKVFDENNCELTQQLKEHWRHQVIDYKAQTTTV